MDISRSVHNLWRVKRAVTISGIHKPQDEEVRERLRRRGWDLGGRTNRIPRGMQEVIEGRASFIIIEDSENLPAPAILRRLITNRVTLLTPVLVLISPKLMKEKACFGTIGSPSIVEAPFSPSRVVEEFELMVMKWSQEGMFPAYKAGLELKSGNVQSCVKLLTGLMEGDDFEIGSIAAAALALFFRESNLKTAEKLLLSFLGRVRRNVGVLLALVDLYLESAMPDYALRLLKTAMVTYNEPCTLIPDLIQTHLMLNQNFETIELFKRLHNEKYLREMTNQYLPRIFYAEGLRQQFEASLKQTPGRIHAYDEAWNYELAQRKSQEAS